MKHTLVLAATLLLTACTSGAAPGAPGSITARLNGQYDIFAATGASTK